MRNTGDFCPKCLKGTQMTRVVRVFVGIADLMWSEKTRISRCTSCRWMVRMEEVRKGIYRTIERRYS